MQQITNQLKSVRRMGRALLVTRRLAQCLAVLVPVLIGLGLLDYALRLPGAMRLLIGAAVLALAGVWLATRVGRAVRFWPSLAELARRAERLYPQLSGSLASAVEFSLQPAGYAKPASTASMARLAVDEMQTRSRGVDVKKMINLGPTLKACALALLSVCVLGAVLAAAPGASATAASRWFAPLGDTQWPKVNAVQPMTSEGAVFAADGKLRLRAKVTRGWSEGMRMTIEYRVLDEAGSGEWQRIRVAKQQQTADPDEHLYEALVDVPPPVARGLMAGQRASAPVEVRYTAGDATSDTQTLTLAARPEIKSVVVASAPPDYALGLIGERRTPLHEQADRIASTSAYRGSRITLDVAFNKPLPQNKARDAAKGWLAMAGADAELVLDNRDDLAEGFRLSWVLDKTVAGSFALTDGFGLVSTGTDRQYRIQAEEDLPPTVVLLKPAVDESVLPGAVVDLGAVAEDDVAMRSLRLEVMVPDRANTPEDAEQIAMRELAGDGLMETGRFESLEVSHRLELGSYELLAGDEVLVTAVGQDVYELDGKRHAPERSETRRLRVITERELAEQVRRVLRGVRNTAQSLERNQRIVAERTQDGEPAETAEQQGDIGRRIAAQQETIDALGERLERNAPEDLEVLEGLLERAGKMLDAAQQSSEKAEQSLGEAAKQQQAGEQAEQRGNEAEAAGERDRAEQQQKQAEQAEANQKAAQQEAGEAQAQAQRKLAELVAALDMGESVGEIESELAGLREDAEAVAEKTRELLPKTIGQKPEDLGEEVKREVAENAAAQRELAERAEELIDKMRATAEQIGENGETPEQRATAKTMEQAADIAQRQGLQEDSEQAAEQIEQNQVADATSRQQQAMQTLEQMLEEMGKQQERKQEELKRLLQELAQKIQKLTEEQRDQLARAEEADGGALGVLEQPQFALRRRTLLVEAEAKQSPETAEVGSTLGEAVRDQAEAVKAIRAADKEATTRAQADALAHLEAALELINAEQDQQQQQEQQRERFALREAYYGLADRQDALQQLLAQHERDEDYGRRDWRQINRLYRDRLDDKSFDEEQGAIRQAAAELGEKAGEAMVYQSLHRRMDQAAARAENRLEGRSIDAPVLNDQRAVSRMLRAMGDALDDTADPDKFENEDDPQGEQGGEGGQGQQQDPPLVPDLAQIKLLREMMIQLRQETQSVADSGDALEPAERQARLAELADLQRELKGLGEQLIEKLKQQMQGPPEQEPRN